MKKVLVIASLLFVLVASVFAIDQLYDPILAPGAGSCLQYKDEATLLSKLRFKVLRKERDGLVVEGLKSNKKVQPESLDEFLTTIYYLQLYFETTPDNKGLLLRNYISLFKSVKCGE